jgi:hypothetical protein
VEQRVHPTFHRQLTLLFVPCFLVGGVLMVDGIGLFGRHFLPQTLSIILAATLIFGLVLYGFWAGNHVRCPNCGDRCQRHSDEPGKGRKVVCLRCKIIWDLGTSYNSNSGG